jgi:hypothetical protein
MIITIENVKIFKFNFFNKELSNIVLKSYYENNLANCTFFTNTKDENLKKTFFANLYGKVVKNFKLNFDYNFDFVFTQGYIDVVYKKTEGVCLVNQQNLDGIDVDLPKGIQKKKNIELPYTIIHFIKKNINNPNYYIMINNKKQEIKTLENDVIIFPGTLWHGTFLNNNEDMICFKSFIRKK